MAGSYASWMAGDNLAPAADAAAAVSVPPGLRPADLKRNVSAFAANGGAATMAVRKVAAALKVHRLSLLCIIDDFSS